MTINAGSFLVELESHILTAVPDQVQRRELYNEVLAFFSDEGADEECVEIQDSLTDPVLIEVFGETFPPDDDDADYDDGWDGESDDEDSDGEDDEEESDAEDAEDE